MKEIICPFCGSTNSADAEFCRVCKVAFNQLPDDILPEYNANNRDENPPEAGASSGPADQDAAIPKWLSDIMLRGKKSQGKMEFESFADVIFGVDPVPGSKGLRKKDLSGNERIEDLLAPQKKSDPELSEAPLEIPEAAENSDGFSAEEEQYTDFSYFRPAQKWEDQPIFDSSGENQAEIPPNAEPAPEDENTPVILPIPEDLTGEETEPAEESAPANAQDNADEQGSEPLPEAESGYADTDVKTASGQPEDKALPDSAFEAETVPDITQFINETDSYPSPDRPGPEAAAGTETDKPDTTPGAGSVSEDGEQTDISQADEEFNEEPNLVSAFLSNLDADFSSGTEAQEAPAAETEPVEQDIIAEAEQAAEEENTVPLPSETTPPESEAEAAAPEPDTDLTPVFEAGQRETQDLDAIPWNLFESGEMAFPNSNADPEYKSFSRNQIPPDNEVNNYQHRMILAVLRKLFQAESRNEPLTRPLTRKTNRLVQLVLAVIAFAGVVTLLASGVTDFIRLGPVEPERLPGLSAFSSQITQLDSEDQALIIMDFPPGYGSELLEPAESLIEKIAEQNAGIRLLTTSPLAEIHSQKFLRDFPQAGIENIGYLPGMGIAIQTYLRDKAAETDATFIVSSNFESLRSWIEQLSLAGFPATVNVIASAQMNSLLIPYLRSGGIDSLISGPVEKSVFTGNDFSDQLENRKLFSVWFLCLLAVLIYFAGSFDFTAEKNTAGGGQTELSGIESEPRSGSIRDAAGLEPNPDQDQGEEK